MIKSIVKFIREEFAEAGFTKAVIGMSGGLDSSVVAALTVLALGKDNVTGILMPDRAVKGSGTEDVDDANLVIEHLGIPARVQDITFLVEMFSREVMWKQGNPMEVPSEVSKLRHGNAAARIRMMVLFDHAAANQELVMGTTNLTELNLGYFTIGGDNIAIIEPVISLYKTEMFTLAKALGLPNKIINKKPTARLWDDQTDEQELGCTYEDIDRVLRLPGTSTLGMDTTKYDRIKGVLARGNFKQHLPICYVVSEVSDD
jgi:NAD+ synthase